MIYFQGLKAYLNLKRKYVSNNNRKMIGEMEDYKAYFK
jgi:hypothetical protein